MVIHLPKDGARVGDYTIRHKLGEGGSGYVYKAERGGRYFAIKFLSELEWTGWNRREVTIMVRLQTLNLQIPNVVGFRGCERWPDPDMGYPYIVMDFIPGLTMDKYVQKFNPSARVALGKFLKIARAMGAVHRLDVLHRDLKEFNIIIRADDGEPVVIDFGYGAMKGLQTETGPGRVPPGTPEYRSPEIIKFLRGETEGDIYTYTVPDELWAMGVILYWLLTDVMPFGGRLESGLNDRIRLNTPRAPHLINPRVPESASRLCMRMLEKDPQARFKDDDELCAALEAVLTAEGDASWDLPLIDPHAPHDATTAGNAGADEEPNGRAKEVQQWIAHKPRRGWWPVEEPPAQGAPPAPLPDELPSPGANPEAPAAGPIADGAAPGGTRGVLRWLGASGPLPMGALLVDMLKRPPLALVVGLAVVALAVGSVGPLHKSVPAPSVAPAPEAEKAAPPPNVSARGEVTTQAAPVREVAQPGNPAEANRGAAPVRAQPPAPTPTAMLRKESRLKPEEKPAPQPQNKARRCVPITKWVCTAAGVCSPMLTGCPGAQVLPEPAPMECPAGSRETHTKFRLGGTGEVVLQGYKGEAGEELATMKEGPVTVVLDEGWDKLPPGTLLTGTLTVGEKRFFGRFTQAQTPDRQTYPVCIQVYNRGESVMRGGQICHQGVGYCLLPGGKPDAFKVFPRLDVQATSHFE